MRDIYSFGLMIILIIAFGLLLRTCDLSCDDCSDDYYDEQYDDNRGRGRDMPARRRR